MGNAICQNIVQHTWINCKNVATIFAVTCTCAALSMGWHIF